MPPLKVTPQTAIATVVQLARDVQRCYAEHGSSPLQTQQVHRLDELVSNLPARSFALIAGEPVTPEVIELPGSRTLTVIASERHHELELGGAVPPCVVVMPEHLAASRLRDAPIVLTASSAPVTVRGELTLKVADAREGVRFLKSPGLDPLLQIAASLSATTAAESSLQILRSLLDEQVRESRARRLLLQAALHRYQVIDRQPVDWLSEGKTLVARTVSGFERSLARGVSEAVAFLVAPRPEYALPELTRTRSSRGWCSTLDEPAEKSILDDIDATLTQAMEANAGGLRSSWIVLEENLAALLRRHNVSVSLPPLQQCSPESITGLMDLILVLEKRFEFDVPKGGFMEQAMSARRYLTFALMMLSLFGLSSVRSRAEIFVPASLLLMGVGAALTWKQRGEQQVESRRRERQKLAEYVRSERRRIAQAWSRQWTALLMAAVNENQAAWVGCLERAAKLHNERRQIAVAEEKAHLQRQSGVLDAADRKLALQMKQAESLAAALSQLQAELRGLLHSAARSSCPEALCA